MSAATRSRWWVLAQSAACLTGTCDESLLTTSDGGRSFRVLRALPIAAPATVYAAAGGRDLFISGVHGDLWLSADGGRSWRSVTPTSARGRRRFAEPPQAADGYAYTVVWSSRRSGNQLLRAPLKMLWSARHPGTAWRTLPAPAGSTMGLMVRGKRLLVLSQPSGYGLPRIYASQDAGSSFRATGATLNVIGCAFAPGGAAIWAQCTTGMLFGIWRSTDGGRSFTAAGSDAYRQKAPSHPVFAGTSGAGFAALSASVALLGRAPFYRTTDAGASYHRLPGSPPGVVQWLQFDVVNSGYVLALGRFTVPGGTGASSRFGQRLYAVTDLGTHFRPIRIR